MEDKETTHLFWQLSGTIALTRILDNKDFSFLLYSLLSNILNWVPIKKNTLDSETPKKINWVQIVYFKDEGNVILGGDFVPWKVVPIPSMYGPRLKLAAGWKCTRLGGKRDGAAIMLRRPAENARHLCGSTKFQWSIGSLW